MSRGIKRERAVRKYLEEEGYWVIRAAGSKGDADLVALKAGKTPLFVEVKSDVAGPFAHFRPADRAELLAAAEKAGAEAVLAFWPPRAPLTWIRSENWPAQREAT